MVDVPDLAEVVAEVETRVTAELGREGYDDAWSRCMAERGFTELGAPREAVEQSRRALRSVVYGSTGSEASRAALDLEALAAAERDEIALAVADARCRAEVGYFARFRELLEEELARRFG